MRRARDGNRSRRGMTIVELLAATAIFLGLAGMVLQVLGGGLDLWATGERTRDDSEQAEALLDRLSLEFRHAVACDGGAGEPRVKFLCDFVSVDSDGDGQRDFRAQRVIFVRRLFEAGANPLLRRAGLTSGDAATFIGETPRDGGGQLLATEGLAEAAFLAQPDQRKGYEGRMVIWRALRSPIGGKESLFAAALKDDSGLGNELLQPIAENVLLFELAFLDASVADPSAPPDAQGPLVVWDSTRGILPPGDGYTGFRHGRSPASLANADDDVFPSAVRITVVVAPPPGEAPEAETVQEVPASSVGGARVDLRQGLYLKKWGAAARTLKIGQEWVEVGETDGSSLAIGRRGLYGTAISLHKEGTHILIGRRFTRVVPLPCAREDLVSRDLKRDRR